MSYSTCHEIDFTDNIIVLLTEISVIQYHVIDIIIINRSSVPCLPADCLSFVWRQKPLQIRRIPEVFPSHMLRDPLDEVCAFLKSHRKDLLHVWTSHCKPRNCSRTLTVVYSGVMLITLFPSITQYSRFNF